MEFSISIYTLIKLFSGVIFEFHQIADRCTYYVMDTFAFSHHNGYRVLPWPRVKAWSTVCILEQYALSAC